MLLLLIAIVIGGATALLVARGGRARPLPAPGDPMLALSPRTPPDEQARGEIAETLAALDRELQGLRDGLRDALEEHAERTTAMNVRATETDDHVAQAVTQALTEMRRAQQIELTGLRESLGAAIETVTARAWAVDHEARGKRSEAIGLLDRRLAKLEIAFGTVIDPMSLPGEPPRVPPELPREALRWESWKEVGDAAFAFAESFATERIHLEDQICRELTDFIASVRATLTIAIYPALVGAGHPSAEETREALHAPLERLAADIPAARSRLRGAYVEATGG